MTRALQEGTAAGLGRRAVALVYEALILTAVLFAGALPFIILVPPSLLVAVKPFFQVYLLVLCGGYFIWQWLHGGQTLPMKTWRLKVVTNNGEPLTWRHCIHRFIFAFIGLVSCGGGFLWAFFDGERRFLHDRLAGTRIVNSRH